MEDFWAVEGQGYSLSLFTETIHEVYVHLRTAGNSLVSGTDITTDKENHYEVW